MTDKYNEVSNGNGMEQPKTGSQNHKKAGTLTVLSALQWRGLSDKVNVTAYHQSNRWVFLSVSVAQLFIGLCNLLVIWSVIVFTLSEQMTGGAVSGFALFTELGLCALTLLPLLSISALIKRLRCNAKNPLVFLPEWGSFDGSYEREILEKMVLFHEREESINAHLFWLLMLLMGLSLLVCFSFLPLLGQEFSALLMFEKLMLWAIPGYLLSVVCLLYAVIKRAKNNLMKRGWDILMAYEMAESRAETLAQ